MVSTYRLMHLGFREEGLEERKQGLGVSGFIKHAGQP